MLSASNQYLRQFLCCRGIDSTGFSTYVWRNCTKVTGLLSFDNITQLSIPEQQPNEIDVTTVHDNEKQTIFGQREAPKATFTLIADPLAVTSKEMAKADATATRRVIKIKLISGYTGIFNAFVSGGADSMVQLVRFLLLLLHLRCVA